MKLLKDRFFSFHTSVLYLYHFYPCLLLLYLSTPFQIMTSSYFGYYLVIIVTQRERHICEYVQTHLYKYTLLSLFSVGHMYMYLGLATWSWNQSAWQRIKSHMEST